VKERNVTDTKEDRMGEPTPLRLTMDEMLEEQRTEARAEKFLIMAARRTGGQLQPIMFVPTMQQAEAVQEALTIAGYATVEIYRRVDEPEPRAVGKDKTPEQEERE
jgi:hypothetical protein